MVRINTLPNTIQCSGLVLFHLYTLKIIGIQFYLFLRNEILPQMFKNSIPQILALYLYKQS